MRCIDAKSGLVIAALAGLAGCTSPVPLGTPAPAPAARAPSMPAPASPTQIHRHASQATSERAYRQDAARAIYAAYPDSIYKGKLPPMLYAIAVVETELDSKGNVREVRMLRAPSHAPEVTARVRELIRKASPLPAPHRLGAVKYTDTWLVDKSGRFQLDTLTEGQL
ncbi:hypothetical protein [uncultured Piscinibacter sp.]|uniref:hypothetical protein n=1 Tax=uncultured Piscinibacter sp. TaxID=1131835 RepID=UPI002630E52D|nr:hypothetical protein [uncultured Piscinibacter sp.]